MKAGIFPDNGSLQTISMKLDNSKTEKSFGFKRASYEQMAVNVVEHYLELLEKERGEKVKQRSWCVCYD